MATLKIEPIQVVSRDHNRVVITGISPTDHDCIVRQYWTGAGMSADGPHNGLWNLFGIRRGGTPGENLDMSGVDLAELAKLARKLGAT